MVFVENTYLYNMFGDISTLLENKKKIFMTQQKKRNSELIMTWYMFPFIFMRQSVPYPSLKDVEGGKWWDDTHLDILINDTLEPWKRSDHRVISHSRFHHFENFKSRFRISYNFSLCKVSPKTPHSIYRLILGLWRIYFYRSAID